MQHAINNTAQSKTGADQRLARILDRCLADLQAGKAVDRDALLAEHADIALDLAGCLDSLELVQGFHAAEGLPGDLNADGPFSQPLGDYRIIREVGRGGMGVVYEAEQLSLGRRVALKVLPFASMLDPRHLQRFKNEALAAAHLDHPNIVEVYGVGCERGVHFYAMRYVEGQTLAEVIEALKGVPAKDEGRITKDESSPLAPRDGTSCATGSASASSAGTGRGVHAPCQVAGLPSNETPLPPGEGRVRDSAEDAVSVGNALRGVPDPPNDVAPAVELRPSSFVLRTSADTVREPIAALSTLRTTKPKDFYRTVAQLGIQAAEALDHAHQMGIVHRDIKPSNLMIESRMRNDECGMRTPAPSLQPLASSLRLFITDFGLAHIESDPGAANLTMTGDLLGTLRYMSPEQAEGRSAILDHRTDIYSLGITLYELITLRPAFPATDRQTLLKQISQDEPTAPRKLNKSLPADLETIVLKSIAKHSADRYPSAGELAVDLRSFLSDKPIVARRPGSLTRIRKWCRRHAPLLWATGISAMIGIAIAAATLGWTLRDRQLRLASAHREIDLALNEAALFMQQENWPDALASVRRADALSASTSASDELAAKRLQIRRDAEMAIRLERIRLDHASTFGVDGIYNFSGSVSEYSDAFREYGLDIAELPQREAVERIRQSAIAEQLRLALEEWLQLADKSADAGPRPQILLAIANEVDPDEWRARLREAMLSAPDVRRTRLLDLATAVKDRPLPAQTVVLIARHLRTHGASEQAEPLLHATYLRNAADFDVCFELGHAYRTMNPPHFDEAIRFFSTAVACRPGSACAHNNLGYILLQKGAISDSIACFREALNREPDFGPAHHNLGFALSKSKPTREAISHYRAAIRLLPTRAVSSTNLGNLFNKQGAYDEAINCLKEAIRRQPEYAMAHQYLGDAYLEKGDLDAAIESFREALRLGSDSALMHDSLGVALSRKRAYDEAIDNYGESIRLQPSVARVHCSLAHALVFKGAIDEGILSFRETIRLDPESTWSTLAYKRLGSLYFQRADWQNAIDSFRHVIRLDAADPIARYNLGNALLNTNAADEAIESLSEAIRLKPDYAKAHNTLGNAYAKKGDYGEAMLHWKETLRINPNSAHTLSSIGVALHKQGDLKGAIEMHRKALVLNPKYAEAHHNLACALRDRGDVVEALQSFEEALRLNPNGAATVKEYGRLRATLSEERPPEADSPITKDLENAVDPTGDEKRDFQKKGLTEETEEIAR